MGIRMVSIITRLAIRFLGVKDEGFTGHSSACRPRRWCRASWRQSCRKQRPVIQWSICFPSQRRFSVQNMTYLGSSSTSGDGCIGVLGHVCQVCERMVMDDQVLIGPTLVGLLGGISTGTLDILRGLVEGVPVVP